MSKTKHSTVPARVFFTADTHFGHTGVMEMSKRRFGSTEEHDEALIAAWNAVVGPRDTVWHLGDFAMKSSPERCAEVFSRLRGRKCFIRGNHDRDRVLDLPWSEAPSDLQVIKIPFADGFQPGGYQQVVLTHYAMRSWPHIHHGAINLFGHTHASMPGTCRSCDVGVDAWNMRPVTLAEIVPWLQASPAEPEEFEIRRRQEAERAREAEQA
ncbi:Calcineurin-like phosphoesterase superfamily protein [Methylobacterium sp. 174MFSha1.1]|uniref:metallophosphoesterase n=1 Tax=Methylobacterium sp. 174MFSha1.1 TaxID=1502749 RepID=UPI0008ED6822|nr:metallophosphoesterase [Methylobacterium sp. 174MFSha1.1]SFU34690.1 Calcineurin-like phosphoesterase superfamily protein [Methylobacterium sp. 174MFSha1.1]